MLRTSGHERVENDFYGTIDLDCTHILLNFLAARGTPVRNKTVWEPACGQGHISKVVRLHGGHTIETDIAPQIPGAQVFDFTGEEDFTHLDAYADLPLGDPDFIISNPPYKRDVIDAFMTKCVMYARDYGITCAMLMRNEVDSAITRRKFFSECPQHDVKLTLLWRPRWIADSTGSPRHNYAWHIWSRSAGNRPAEIHYAARPKAA
jgi:hypothetical protein